MITNLWLPFVQNNEQFKKKLCISKCMYLYTYNVITTQKSYNSVIIITHSQNWSLFPPLFPRSLTTFGQFEGWTKKSISIHRGKSCIYELFISAILFMSKCIMVYISRWNLYGFTKKFLVNDIKINKLVSNMHLNQIPFIDILICLFIIIHWMCSKKGPRDQSFYKYFIPYYI